MLDIDKELRKIKFGTAHPSELIRQKTQQLVREEVQKTQHPKRLGRLAWGLASAVAVFAVFIILFTLPQAEDKVSYYTVDINPSISMQVNASQMVLEVSAENDDAVMLLKNVKLEGLPFDKALSECVKVADEQGYLKDEGHVLVAHFGDTESLTQKEIENVVSGATERKVTALLLQSTKAEFEQVKNKNGQPGIELLKKQAADEGIKEQGVDEIIEQIRGKSAKQHNVGENTPKENEKADSRQTPTAAKNDQSEKNNGSGAGNSENAVEQGTSNNGNSSKDDKEVKENSSNDDNKTAETSNGNQSSNQNSGNNQNNHEAGNNENSSSKENNGNDREKDKQNKQED